MPLFRRRSLGTLLVILLYQPLTALCFDTDQLRERLLSEAPRAQRELRRSYVAGLAFRVRAEIVRTINGETARQSNDEHLILTYPSRIAETLFSGGPTSTARDRVTGLNEDYCFDLRGTDAQSWMVTDISTGDAKAFFIKGAYKGLAELNLEQLFLHATLPVLDVEAVPIDTLLTDFASEIRSVALESDGRIAVTFDGDIQTPTGFDRLVDGTVWLSPDRSWIVDEYRFHVTAPKDTAVVHHAVMWSESSSLPFPLSISRKAASLTRAAEVEYKWHYRDVQLSKTGPARFHLSYYGLPEPGLVPIADTLPQPKDNARTLFWGINAVGGALLIIGLIIRFRHTLFGG